MQRISSNWTLLLKIFIPTFWIMFFGLLTAFVLFSDPETSPFSQSFSSKSMVVVAYIIFALFLYFTVIKLLRLDMAEDGLYVSNYFKTYRYKYIDVKSIKESDFFLFHTLKITMKEKTSLGKNFRILIKKNLWDNYLKNHPQLFEHLMAK